MANNKVFWVTGIHLFNSPLPFSQNENFSLEQMIKETWKYAKATLHSHSAIASFGSADTVYLVRPSARGSSKLLPSVATSHTHERYIQYYSGGFLKQII